MTCYKDRTYCNTVNCRYFKNPICKNRILTKEIEEEALKVSMPISITKYDLDKDDYPIGCANIRGGM